ncbi:hypothetical protein A2U01_0046646, partial [Trifolium medium]|nr:hypothetical protein [Trifolium medium]
SLRSNRIFLWNLRVAHHGMAPRAVEAGNTKMSLWKLCVAQDGLARRASRKFKLSWRNGYLRVAQYR